VKDKRRTWGGPWTGAWGGGGVQPRGERTSQGKMPGRNNRERRVSGRDTKFSLIEPRKKRIWFLCGREKRRKGGLAFRICLPGGKKRSINFRTGHHKRHVKVVQIEAPKSSI